MHILYSKRTTAVKMFNNYLKSEQRVRTPLKSRKLTTLSNNNLTLSKNNLTKRLYKKWKDAAKTV